MSLFAIPVDGGSPAAIPGTSGGIYPVGSPDGETVAFVRVRGHDSEEVTQDRVIRRTRSRRSLWLARLDGSASTRLTPWSSDASDIPGSFSPDGNTLVVTQVRTDRDNPRPPRTHARPVLLDLRTGKARPLGPGVGYAAFSPDGTKLALVKERPFPHPHVTRSGSGKIIRYGETDIYVEDLATHLLTRITSGPASDFGPTWDPSGQRLAFARVAGAGGESSILFGTSDSIYEVNADGSCLTRVVHEPHAGNLGPVWRPGPERGAGPIAC